MGKKADTKRVCFYRYVLTKGGNRSMVTPPDWKALLQAWQRRSFAEKTIGDIHFLPDLTTAYPAVGLHKEVDGAFQTLLDKEDASVQDVLDSDVDEDAVKIRANSSVAMFLPGSTIVAVTLGNGQAPRYGSLVHFLSEVLPPQNGMQWKIIPLADEAKIEEFKAADGVRKVELAFDTTKDLLSAGDSQGSIFHHIDGIASGLESEFTVTLTLELTEPYRQRRGSRRAFWRSLNDSLPRLTQAKRAIVYPSSSDGSETEALNLGVHNFVVETPISEDKIASRTFGNLVTATASVMREWHNELMSRT